MILSFKINKEKEIAVNIHFFDVHLEGVMASFRSACHLLGGLIVLKNRRFTDCELVFTLLLTFEFILTGFLQSRFLQGLLIPEEVERAEGRQGLRITLIFLQFPALPVPLVFRI